MADQPTARRSPTIVWVMMPRDTNAIGPSSAGVLLSYIDQAAFIGARRCRASVRHRGMDRIEFKEPVFVGDVLSFYADPVQARRTSLRVRVTVWAERFANPGPGSRSRRPRWSWSPSTRTATPSPSPPARTEPGRRKTHGDNMTARRGALESWTERVFSVQRSGQGGTASIISNGARFRAAWP